MFHTQRAFHKNISVNTKSRPVRIAYLLEDSASAAMSLDQIFRNAYKRWGGRYTLIIPLVNGEIYSKEYWEWLNEFDPDVIYALSPVNKTDLEKINRKLCPFFIVNKNPYMDWLSSKSTASARNVGTLLNIQHKLHNSNFLLNNFGQIYQIHHIGSLGSSVPDINSDSILLDYVYRRNLIISEQELSSILCEHLVSASHPWNSVINIFIGSSFTDRISFWNSYLSDSNGENYKKHSLIIEPELFKDESFVNSFKTYLKKLPPTIKKIRSSALNDKQIKEIIDQLCDSDPDVHPHIGYEKIESINECAKRSKYGHMSLRDSQPVSTQLINSSEFHLKFEPPNFLNNHIGHHEYLKQKFIVEIDVERDENYSNVINAQHYWQFPRIPHLASVLFKNENIDSRINSRGDLICSSSQASCNSILMAIPEDNVIFSRILHGRGFMHPHDLQSLPFEKYFDSKVSDKGYYLYQILTIFGGAKRAFNYFSNEFIRGLFTKFCESDENNNIQNIVSKKVNKINDANLTKQRIIDLAKELIYRCATMVKNPSKKINSTDIQSNYLEMLAKLPHHQNDDEINTVEEDTLRLEKSIQYLVSKKILSQGYIVTCESCRFKNWIEFSTLARSILCVACEHEIYLPIYINWFFKINTMLRNAINEHGIISQILTLIKLRDEAKQCFYFSPPVIIYKKESIIFTDIDIFCIQDGKLIVGEVKTSEREIDEVDKLIEIARNLNADKLIISIPTVNIDLNKKNKIIQNIQNKFDVDYTPEVALYSLDDMKFYYDNADILP